MPTIVIRRACFISLLSAFRITEWFQAPPVAASGTARPAGTKTNPQRDLPVIARRLESLGATQRPVDAGDTERGVHSVWLRRRCWLCELPWLAPPQGQARNASIPPKQEAGKVLLHMRWSRPAAR